MTTFDRREKAFEEKFAHDTELQFKAAARRNKMAGMWAAQQLGLDGADAEAYAREVVKADLEEPGDEDVVRKIHGDFTAKGVDISPHRIQKMLDSFMGEARRQIMTETD